MGRIRLPDAGVGDEPKLDPVTGVHPFSRREQASTPTHCLFRIFHLVVCVLITTANALYSLIRAGAGDEYQ
jgi:hypothetical protein